jgi:hypothetical protein
LRAWRNSVPSASVLDGVFDALELAVIGLPPSEDLAMRLLKIGFKHLIFSLPVGDAKQTIDDLDTRAELARKLRAIGA